MDVMNPKPFTDNCTVAVHTNPHHPDDVFCVACILLINPNVKIIRTRDKEIFDKADFRIDIGGKYVPSTGDYDHHQNDFLERHTNPNPAKHKQGPKCCAFSLIWKHYGKLVIKALLDKLNKETDKTWNVNEDIIDYIDESVVTNIVTAIATMDNGEQRTYYLDTGPIRMPSIIKFIQNYNPCSWIEGWDYDKFFYKAVDIAQKYLEREVIKLYGQVQAVEPVLDAVSKAKDGYMILDQYLPWGPIFTRFPFDSKDIKMVIYPTNDEWMFQSPYIKMVVDKDRFLIDLPNGEKRRQRYLTPTNLHGKGTEEIKDITGIDGVSFIHSSGFVGSAKTIEAALAISKYIVEHQEYTL